MKFGIYSFRNFLVWSAIRFWISYCTPYSIRFRTPISVIGHSTKLIRFHFDNHCRDEDFLRHYFQSNSCVSCKLWQQFMEKCGRKMRTKTVPKCKSLSQTLCDQWTVFKSVLNEQMLEIDIRKCSMCVCVLLLDI